MAKVAVIGSSYMCDQGAVLTIAEGNFLLKSEGKLVVDESCNFFTPVGFCKDLTQKAGGNPVPCFPNITGWEGAEGSVKVDGKKIITENCKAKCSVPQPLQPPSDISFLKGPNLTNVSIK